MKADVNPHNCEELLRRMNRALDGDLSNAEMLDFIAELDRCSCCFKTYEVERSFKEFLRSKLERRCLDKAHQQHLRDMVQGMMDTGNSAGL